MEETVRARVKWLVDHLNTYTTAYEEGNSLITDEEWDNYYFELVRYEKLFPELIRSDSPTQKVVYNIVNELKKVKHNHLMLSLDKTKDIEDVKKFLKGNSAVAMLKMDGLTVSLTYKCGKLVAAETRGNGEIGEDIYHNALVIKSIPKYIDYKNDLIVDGEIICKYDDFEPFSKEYKNPRNFAAGSLRLLDSKECEKRHLTFVAWDIIDNENRYQIFEEKIHFLKQLNFTVVNTHILPVGLSTTDKPLEEYITKTIDSLKEEAKKANYPIDGLVFKYDDCRYGESLGHTDHHFRNGLALKFYDEAYESKLIDIEWGLGRTGVITPVAIFESIEIDGTEVSRASLHNLSVLRETLNKPYIGQKINVIKANMIIPMIVSAEKIAPDEAIFIEQPKTCSVCGAPLEVKNNEGVKTLWCTGEECSGKLLYRLDHFCSKKGLDIKGLSENTLNKLCDKGWLNSLTDIYKLKNHRDEWASMPGFGAISVDKILEAIEKSKECPFEKFLSAISIPLVGNKVAKIIAEKVKNYDTFIQMIREGYNFSQWDSFGEIMSNAILNFDYSEASKLCENYLHIIPTEKNTDTALNGLIICVTGKLHYFKSRSKFAELIEKHGGKVTDSVSKKTSILITNDTGSGSAKATAAQKLNIPILSEDDFLNKYNLKGEI